MSPVSHYNIKLSIRNVRSNYSRAASEIYSYNICRHFMQFLIAKQTAVNPHWGFKARIHSSISRRNCPKINTHSAAHICKLICFPFCPFLTRDLLCSALLGLTAFTAVSQARFAFASFLLVIIVMNFNLLLSQGRCRKLKRPNVRNTFCTTCFPSAIPLSLFIDIIYICRFILRIRDVCFKNELSGGGGGTLV